MKTRVKAALRQKPKRFRTDVVRGLREADETVDRMGGDYGAGLIRGTSVITRGEALGHGLWIDKEFCQSVADALDASEEGIKSRFTHPSLSGDGLGKTLGRSKGGKLEGDVVRSDLHLTKTSHKAPDGDLAGYVMDLADEDPGLFGTSIVYRPDFDAERKFIEDHGGAFDEDGFAILDDEGNIEGFESPDPKNVENLPHARMEELLGVDAVDDPAANPEGLFHRGAELVREADAVASYCLGLSKQRPTVTQFDLDPDRVLGFAQRFLTQHGLEIVRKESKEPIMNSATAPKKPHDAKPAPVEKPVTSAPEHGAENPRPANPPAEPAPAGPQPVRRPEDEKEPVKAPEPDPGDAMAPKPGQAGGQPGPVPAAPTSQAKGPGAAFLSAFGAKGGVWFAEGRTFEEAQALHTQEQATEIARLKSDNERLQKLATAGRGEAAPVSFQAEGDKNPKAAKLNQNLGTNLGRFAAGLKFATPSRN